MNEIKSTGDATAFARGSGEHYKKAIDRCKEDGQLRRFKYLLKRVTAGGALSFDEAKSLQKVGEAVFKEEDPGDAVQKVVTASANPLAIAIANAALKESTASRQRSLLGAALGAHASHAMADDKPDKGLIVYAAVIGSATAETTQMIHDFLGNGWDNFGQDDD
jgi:hypothetical protein